MVSVSGGGADRGPVLPEFYYGAEVAKIVPESPPSASCFVRRGFVMAFRLRLQYLLEWYGRFRL
jgi:hypothetical protein